MAKTFSFYDWWYHQRYSMKARELSRRLKREFGIDIAPADLIFYREEELPLHELISLYSRRKNEKIEELTLGFLIRAKRKGIDPHLMIDAYRRAKNNHLHNVVTPEMLNDIALAKGDMLALVNVAKTAENTGIKYDLKDLISQRLPKGIMPIVIDGMVLAFKSGYPIKQEEILDFYREVGSTYMITVESLDELEKEKIPREIIEELTKYRNLKIKNEKFDPLIDRFSDADKAAIKKHTLLGHLEKFVRAYVKAKQTGIALTVRDFIMISERGGDVEKFVNSMIKIQRRGIEPPIEIFLKSILPGQLMGRIAKIWLKALEAEIDVKLPNLMDVARITNSEEGVEKIVDAMIKMHTVGIDVSYRVLEHFTIDGGDPEDLIKGLIVAEKSKLNITIEDFKKYYWAGKGRKSIEKYANAVNIMKNVIGYDDAKAKLDDHIAKGGDPTSLSLGLLKAKKLGINLDYINACIIDKFGENVLNNVVTDAANPKSYHIHPIRVIAKDGIVLNITVSVVLRIAIERYGTGSNEDVIFKRVEEALLLVCEHYKDHHDIMNNRKPIAEIILKKLQGHEEAEHHASKDPITMEAQMLKHNNLQKDYNLKSRFNIEEIVLSDIQFGEDIFAEHKLADATKKAKMIIAQAEANKLDADAQIKLAFADALKLGKISSLNELHKFNIYNKEKKVEPPKEEKNDNGHGNTNESSTDRSHGSDPTPKH